MTDEPEDDADYDCLEDRLDAAYARADATPPRCPKLLDYDEALVRRMHDGNLDDADYDAALEEKAHVEWALLCGLHAKDCECVKAVLP